MSISRNSSPLDAALSKIPATFRSRILSAYIELKDRHSRAQFDSNFDSAGLSAGKFCESVLRFLQQTLTGAHVAFGKHIPNFADECRALVTLPQTAGPESLRIIIPRALVFLYTLRGKRGIGHVGGDVEANGIDAAAIVRVSDWIVCELIRIYHSLSLEEAQGIVDSISTRSIPVIWEVGGKKRILRTDLDYKQQVLVLAYSDLQGGVLSEDLFDWTEYSSLSMFRKAVLQPLHNQKLIEYDKESELVYLSPLGIEVVEKQILHPKKTSVGKSA